MVVDGVIHGKVNGSIIVVVDGKVNGMKDMVVGMMMVVEGVMVEGMMVINNKDMLVTGASLRRSKKRRNKVIDSMIPLGSQPPSSWVIIGRPQCSLAAGKVCQHTEWT
jgi:ribosomal protein L24